MFVFRCKGLKSLFYFMYKNLRVSSITKGNPIMQVHDSVKCVAQKLGTNKSISRILHGGVHYLYVK